MTGGAADAAEEKEPLLCSVAVVLAPLGARELASRQAPPIGSPGIRADMSCDLVL